MGTNGVRHLTHKQTHNLSLSAERHFGEGFMTPFIDDSTPFSLGDLCLYWYVPCYPLQTAVCLPPTLPYDQTLSRERKQRVIGFPFCFFISSWLFILAWRDSNNTEFQIHKNTMLVFEGKKIYGGSVLKYNSFCLTMSRVNSQKLAGKTKVVIYDHLHARKESKYSW